APPVAGRRRFVALGFDPVAIHVGQLRNPRKSSGRMVAELAQDVHQRITLRTPLPFPPGVRQLVHRRLILDATDHDQLAIAEPVPAAHWLVERADFESQRAEIRNSSWLERLSN